MHTVIITDPQTTKEFAKYKHLYAPFLADRGGSISHCLWHKSGTEINTAVPNLYDAIKGHPEWRAIIVVKSPQWDELNNFHNPFDFIDNSTGELSVEENKVPLVRLTYMLAGFPSLGVKDYKTGFVYYDEKSDKFKDCIYNGKPILMDEITNERNEARKKHNIECRRKGENPTLESYEAIDIEIVKKYQEILNTFGGYRKQKLVEVPYTDEEKKKYNDRVKQYAFNENRPVEVLILSTREQITYDEREETRESIKRAWQFFDEIESSDFWKVYPNTCRFICFDLINKNHTLYTCEYWKFFLLALSLAVNEIPGHALQAYHLYKADLQINEKYLEQVYSPYIENLMSLQEIIQERMTHIPELTIGKNKELVPDHYISVGFGHVDENKVKTKNDIFGLATDCPKDEKEYWQEHLQNISPIVDDILFAPQEIVAEKALETRLTVDNFANTKQVLDRFQTKRIEKRIDELEPHVINSKLFKLLDTDVYKKEIEQSAEKVQKHIKIRMTKKTVIFISVCSLFVYLCGYIPYLVNSAKDSLAVFGRASILVLITLILLTGIGFLTLYFFRWKLKKLINLYNKDVADVFDRVKKSARVFSNYFSRLCTYMFARSLLIGIDHKKDSDSNEAQKLREHLEHLNSEIEKIKNICSLYDVNIDTSIPHRTFENITEKLLEEAPRESRFYELPKDTNTMKLTAAPTIKLARKMLTSKKNDQWDQYDTGLTLNAPYSFISGINLAREEIYRKEGA